MSSSTPTVSFDARDEGVAADATLRAALDLLNAGVLLLSPELRVTYANARWSRWAGGPVVAGTALATLVEEVARDRLALLDETLHDGQPRSLQLWMKPMRAD